MSSGSLVMREMFARSISVVTLEVILSVWGDKAKFGAGKTARPTKLFPKRELYTICDWLAIHSTNGLVL